MSNLVNALIDLPPAMSLLLKVTVILGVGWVLHFALWRVNPRWRVLLWRAVAAGVLLVPLIGSVMPAFDLAMPASSPEVIQAVAVNQPKSVVDYPGRPAVLINQFAPTAAEPAFNPIMAHPWLAAGAVYVLICAALAIKLTINLRSLNRMLAESAPIDPAIAEKFAQIKAMMGIERKVGLRASSVLSSPFLYGLRRPVIILPERMTHGDYVKELPGIFVHELAHLQGRDLVWMNLIHLLSIALWFHPFAWRMRAAHAASCEAVCDAVAAEHVGSALNYSRTLARIALELVALPPAVGGIPMARMPEIRRRLELLKSKIRANRLALRWVICAMIVGFLSISIIARTRLVYAADKPAGDLIEFLIARNEASKEKIKNVSYAFDKSYQRYSRGKNSVRTSGEVIKKGNSERSTYRQENRETRFVANDQYIAFVTTQFANAQWYDYPTTQSRMTQRIVEARKSHTPSNGDIQSCFGLPNQPLREMVAAKNTGTRYEAVETKDESGRRIYHLRRFMPGRKDPKSPEAVWVIDPDKGYLITGMTSYHEDGSVWLKNNVKLKEVSDGAWFPVEFSETYNDSQLQYERSMTINDIRLNPPVDESEFVIEALDLKSLDPRIVFLRVEADGTKSVYANENGKLVKTGITNKPGRQTRFVSSELTGTVTDPKNDPVKGALVYIYAAFVEKIDPAKPLDQRDKGTYTYTDAQGAFKIPALVPGNWFEVLVMADGYAPELVEKAAPKLGPVQVVLTPEPDQMKPGHAVYGKIVDQDGKPVSGARVMQIRARRPNGGIKLYAGRHRRSVINPIAIADLDGRFVLKSDEAGLSMWLDFFSPKMTSLQVRDVKTSDEVQVFKMSPGATVVGKLYHAGKPVADAHVELRSKMDQKPSLWSGYEVTDKDGNYVFEHVNTGRDYNLSSVITQADVRMEANKSVRVESDAQRIDVGSIQLEPVTTFKLSGNVVLSDGKPIPNGACIHVQRGMESHTAGLGADGRFEFKGLPADTYSITPMRIPGYVLSKKNDRDPINGFAPRSGAMDPVTKKIDRDTNVTIMLEPGQATPVYMVTTSDGMITAMASGNQPEPKPALIGMVLDQNEKPIAGATVLISHCTERVPTRRQAYDPFAYPDLGKRATTDAQGMFAIEVQNPDLRFDVIVMATGYEPRNIKNVNAGDLMKAQLRPDPERIKPGHTILGKVIDEKGQPVAGAVVEPVVIRTDNVVKATAPELSEVDPRAITNDKGEFKITCHASGLAVDLKINGPGVATKVLRAVTLSDELQTFSMGAGGVVFGKIIDNGKPLGGVTLAMIQNIRGAEGFSDIVYAQTDASGAFAFPPVAAGFDYSICQHSTSIDHGNVPNRTARVERDRERVDLGTIETEPGVNFSGVVILSDKKPIPNGARVMIVRLMGADSKSTAVAGDGKFEFKNLPRDTYTVSVQGVPGYLISNTNKSDRDDGVMIFSYSGKPIGKKLDRDVTDFRLVLEPGNTPASFTVTAGEDGVIRITTGTTQR